MSCAYENDFLVFKKQAANCRIIVGSIQYQYTPCFWKDIALSHCLVLSKRYFAETTVTAPWFMQERVDATSLFFLSVGAVFNRDVAAPRRCKCWWRLRRRVWASRGDAESPRKAGTAGSGNASVKGDEDIRPGK
jgi:hypothetical protein